MAESSDYSQVSFQKDYDKEYEAETERRFDVLLRELHLEQAETRNNILTKPLVIAEVKGILTPCIILLNKYREYDMVGQITKLQDMWRIASSLDIEDTISRLEYLSGEFAKIMARHNFKDKVKERYPWDYNVKKKWDLPEMTQELSDEFKVPNILDYYNRINRRWKQFAFLGTYHMVVNEGDVYGLMSAPNLSGKTDTSCCVLGQANFYLREFWRVFEDERQTKPLSRFTLKKDVWYVPAPTDLAMVLGDRYFQTKDLNEGLSAAVNLRSMRQEVIDQAIDAQISRSHHNFIIYEYQIAGRAPTLLIEKFNVWINKMKRRHAVVSIPSALYRKKDMYYMKEIDELRGDDEISGWFKHRNPNYCFTMRTPKLKPKFKKQFKKLQAIAHEERRQGREVHQQLGEIMDYRIKQFWERVNLVRSLALVSIPGLLAAPPYRMTENQIKAFMRRYNEYDLLQALSRGEGEKVVETN